MTTDHRNETKSYDQMCPVAKSLDIIGDRWTLLILREVSLYGPRRFVDFKEGLPGVPPTLLSNRLRMLVSEEILQKNGDARLTTRYSLTQRGRQIRPVLAALRDFGAPMMPKGWKKEMPPQAFRR